MFSKLSQDEHADLKTSILYAVARNPLIKARELHAKFLTRRQISYQGVHKALCCLVDTNVLKKTGLKYELSESWLSNAKEAVEDLEFACKTIRPINIVELAENESVTSASKGAISRPYVWMVMQAHRIKRNFRLPINAVFFLRKAWPLFPALEQQYNKFRQAFQDYEQYVLVQENTPADRHLAGLWKANGFKCSLGVPCAQNCETFVFGDFVFQLWLSKSAKKICDRHYSVLATPADPKSDNPVLKQEIAFESKMPFRMTVTRNRMFAEQVRKQARFFFSSRTQAARQPLKKQ